MRIPAADQLLNSHDHGPGGNVIGGAPPETTRTKRARASPVFAAERWYSPTTSDREPPRPSAAASRAAFPVHQARPGRSVQRTGATVSTWTNWRTCSGLRYDSAALRGRLAEAGLTVLPRPAASPARCGPPGPAALRENTHQKPEEIKNAGNAEADAQSNRSGGPPRHVRRHGRRGACRVGRTERHVRDAGRTWTSHPASPQRPNSSRTKTFDAAEGEIVAFRCSGKSILPIFLLSFVVPSLALSLHRE